MLTRRAKINNSSCSQIVSIHFVTIHSWSVCPAEDRKNQSVPLFWELRVFQNRRCWYDQKTRHWCLLR